MENIDHFHITDYFVFAATLVASLSIGLFFAFRKRKGYNSTDYFFGGGKLNAFPVALSFVVTFQSSLLILGDSAEVYGYGMLFGLRVPGIIIAYTVGGLIAVPIFRPMRITSIYQYFNMRYGANEVRFLAVFAGSMFMVMYMATITLGTSVALYSVMGIPQWLTIIVYTVITAIYTSLGGFKAVIWTDVFQLVVMVTGILATLIKSTIDAGGPSAVSELSNGRLDVADFRLDPTIRLTLWSVIFGSITQFMIIIFSQMGLQRINSTPDLKTAYIMFGISTPIYCLFITCVCLEGVTIFAYYSSIGCEPLASGRITNINEVVPTAVLDLFGHMPGFPGLFIASLSSAALSSLSSCLTALSSITFEDIIKIRYRHISDQNATKIAKIVVFVYGGMSMGITFLLTLMSGGVTAIFQSFVGSLDGPTCGIFILSIFFLRSTSRGVIIGAVSGMIISMVFNLGQTFLSAAPNEYLPLGPIDKCYATNSSNTSLLLSNISTVSTYYWHTDLAEEEVSIPNYFNRSTISPDTTNANSSGLDALKTIFGVSYMWFSFIGFVVTLFVGIFASLCTKPTPKDKVDYICMFPLPDRFCSIFPEGYFYSKTQRLDAKKEESDGLVENDIDKVMLDVFERDDPINI